MQRTCARVRAPRRVLLVQGMPLLTRSVGKKKTKIIRAKRIRRDVPRDGRKPLKKEDTARL